MRAITSVAPPAGNPTMMWRVFFNVCARLRSGAATIAATAEAARTVRRVSMFAFLCILHDEKAARVDSLPEIPAGKHVQNAWLPEAILLGPHRAKVVIGSCKD